MPEKKKNKPGISLRLDEGLKAAITKAAADSGVSINEWILRACREEIKSQDLGFTFTRGLTESAGTAQSEVISDLQADVEKLTQRVEQLEDTMATNIMVITPPPPPPRPRGWGG